MKIAFFRPCAELEDALRGAKKTPAHPTTLHRASGEERRDAAPAPGANLGFALAARSQGLAAPSGSDRPAGGGTRAELSE